MIGSRARNAAFLLLALTAAWVWVLRSAHSASWGKPGEDPALQFYAKQMNRNGFFAGVDRWAYAGMPVEGMLESLEVEGFRCTLPQERTVGGRPRGGVHAMTCTRARAWPFTRMLSVHARFDYDRGGRLMSALATSEFESTGVVPGKVIEWLRKLDWLEPASLNLQGISYDAPQTLALHVADAINPGTWRWHCVDVEHNRACDEQALQRKASGWQPSLDEQGRFNVGRAESMRSALIELGLFATVRAGRDSVRVTGDPLPLRVVDGHIWTDFEGADLAGNARRVAIRLDMDGGRPLEMLVTQGDKTQAFELTGLPSRSGSNAPMLLVPTTKDGGLWGEWLVLPAGSDDHRLEHLGRVLGRVHRPFLPSVTQRVVASMIAHPTADASLGLYPLLHDIEQQARAFRGAGLHSVLHFAQGKKLMGDVPTLAPATRAAWTLASCERFDSAGAGSIDSPCWLHFMTEDPEAANLLRSEAARMQPIYGELETTHPVRARLAVLQDLFNLAGTAPP